ncbi:MAG: D-alanyl-D-alanine carboxypeptidase/D-alanyl-D-alanine-endopeptidase [Candidatus Tectimicrobiota bacterium]
MRWRSLCISVSWALLLGPASPATAGPLLQGRMEAALASSCVPKADIGLHVARLTDGATLATHQADRLFIPASTVKLLTTAAALRVLGPGYRFPTKLYATGPLAGGRLRGDLVLKGFGDPELVSERLWLLAAALRQKGLREVAGDLVIDESFFDDQVRAPTWGGHASTRAFYAPVAPASLNFNAVAVHIEPGPTPGQPARVTLEPETTYLRLVNRATTGPAGSPLRLVVDRQGGQQTNTILARGSIPYDAERTTYYRSITHPWRYLATVFSEVLRREGIAVTGTLREGRVPEGAPELLIFESKPLSRIVQDLNKLSNNYVAESVLKTMGASVHGPPGTYEKGLAVVQDVLSTLEIAPGTYRLSDGSGLSSANRLTPRQITTILTTMWRDFRYRPEYLVSLAVMGMDGSVDERLTETHARQRLRVKTGSLAGVSALSGYGVAADAEELAFSIIINNTTCGLPLMQKVQDAVGLALVTSAAKEPTSP